MALHRLNNGIYNISSQEVWLPGRYKDERTARYAFRFSHAELQKRQDAANARAGGTGGVITYADLQAARRKPK